MVQSSSVTPEIDVLALPYPIPGYGHLPINAYVLKAEQPILIDTGPFLDGMGGDVTEGFMTALRQCIDPADLKWIWLTHADMDHVACVQQVLQEAPEARVATTFMTVGRMSLFQPLPLDRLFLLNPGQTLDLGDRKLTSFKPPSFDAADTAGCYDSKSGALFCADCFGALFPEPTLSLDNITPDQLTPAQLLWATIDAPWLHMVDPQAFAARLDQVRQMDPKWIVGSHLPPNQGMTEQLIKVLASAPTADPFVGPDQAALEQMLSGM